MKKSYHRLLFFQIILLLLLLLNSFVWNILNNYVTIAFLLITILIFKFTLGLEKDRHRYIKDAIFDIIIVLIVSFILYYLFGIVIGFYRVSNYYTIYGIKEFILPIILMVILKEYLRYQMLNKAEGNNLLIIITAICFIIFDISSSIYYAKISSFADIFKFIALILLPAVSRNIASTYITTKLGYKPNIVWLLVLELYIYLMPIIPNPNEYILSIVRFVFPLLLAGKIYFFFEKNKDAEVSRNYKKQNKGFVSLGIATIALLVVIYFTSGYFRYYAVTIVSGSMYPSIKIGDVVVVEKIGNDLSELKKGQVIAYKHSDVIVVHRLMNIIEDNNRYYFYTKGDANDSVDKYVVDGEDIIGIVNLKIPYIGMPTVWLNRL